MAARKNANPPLPPARTPEQRENQLISKAYDLIEKQLDEGTVSAQVLSFLAKRGSGRERAEMRKLESENELLRGKLEQIHDGAEIKQLYSEAMHAMRQYQGQEVPTDEY